MSNEVLAGLRVINELTQGFKAVVPPLHQAINSMAKAVSGKDSVGYLGALTTIDSASDDDRDMMLLLAIQWIATLAVKRQSDALLDDILKETFPAGRAGSKLGTLTETP